MMMMLLLDRPLCSKLRFRADNIVIVIVIIQRSVTLTVLDPASLFILLQRRRLSHPTVCDHVQRYKAPMTIYGDPKPTHIDDDTIIHLPLIPFIVLKLQDILSLLLRRS